MGFFTEISRVWVVIDNNLYMWNYETKWVTKSTDLRYMLWFQRWFGILRRFWFSHFKSCTGGYQKGSIREWNSIRFGRRNHFWYISVPCVQFRRKWIHQYDCRFKTVLQGLKKKTFSNNGMWNTQIALDGATVNDIAHTKCGRVFYTADDQLFEFVYEVMLFSGFSSLRLQLVSLISDQNLAETKWLVWIYKPQVPWCQPDCNHSRNVHLPAIFRIHEGISWPDFHWPFPKFDVPAWPTRNCKRVGPWSRWIPVRQVHQRPNHENSSRSAHTHSVRSRRGFFLQYHVD